MVAERSSPKEGRSRVPTADGEVAAQLQQLYEYILDDRRAEAVGATERLAEQLAVELDRPA